MEKSLLSEDKKSLALLDDVSLSIDKRIDATAFNGLYLAYIRSIFRYIYSKVGDVRQSEDLTAQVFLAALESLPKYRHEGHFAAWLFGIARHKVADHFRSIYAEVPIEITDVEADRGSELLSSVIQKEEEQLVARLINQLDEQDQDLLRLRFVAELGFEEIARLFHTSTEATKKRFYRLLAHLRQLSERGYD